MKRLILLAILIAIVLSIFKYIDFEKIKNQLLMKIYKLDYSKYVEKYANEYDVDKYLIYAIIKAESNFDSNATSTASAKGLMQLMEETAVERSNVINNENVGENDLYDPETNIKLGTSYFAYLLGLYNGNITLAIIAYNAGLGNVQQWIQERYNKIGRHRHRKYSIQRN